jgi:hypothetical protein
MIQRTKHVLKMIMQIGNNYLRKHGKIFVSCLDLSN